MGVLGGLIATANIFFVSSLTWQNPRDTTSALNQKRFSPDDCTKYSLPSLLYIGQGHAGSTTLAELMNEHPGLKYGARKEHHYFACEEDMDDCDSSLEQYLSGFQSFCNVTYTFDASMNYLALASNSYYPAFTLNSNPGVDAVRDVYNALPDAKIMVVIRDPVNYLFSINITEVSDMMQTWDACVADLLMVWMSVYPRSNFLIMRAEDNFADMPSATRKVWDFMGLEPLDFSEAEWSEKIERFEAQGRRRNTQTPPDWVRQQFYSHEKAKNCKARLEQYTGMMFSWLGSEGGLA